MVVVKRTILLPLLRQLRSMAILDQHLTRVIYIYIYIHNYICIYIYIYNYIIFPQELLVWFRCASHGIWPLAFSILLEHWHRHGGCQAAQRQKRPIKQEAKKLLQRRHDVMVAWSPISIYFIISCWYLLCHASHRSFIQRSSWSLAWLAGAPSPCGTVLQWLDRAAWATESAWTCKNLEVADTRSRLHSLMNAHKTLWAAES